MSPLPRRIKPSVLSSFSTARCSKDRRPIDALRAQKPKRLPAVLTKEEVHRVLGNLSGTHLLMAKLLYGSGLRLMECVRLCVKDLDFAREMY